MVKQHPGRGFGRFATELREWSRISEDLTRGTHAPGEPGPRAALALLPRSSSPRAATNVAAPWTLELLEPSADAGCSAARSGGDARKTVEPTPHPPARRPDAARTGCGRRPSTWQRVQPRPRSRTCGSSPNASSWSIANSRTHAGSSTGWCANSPRTHQRTTRRVLGEPANARLRVHGDGSVHRPPRSTLSQLTRRNHACKTVGSPPPPGGLATVLRRKIGATMPQLSEALQLGTLAATAALVLVNIWLVSTTRALARTAEREFELARRSCVRAVEWTTTQNMADPFRHFRHGRSSNPCRVRKHRVLLE